MIPFNRNVNKVNLTLQFEGQCAGFCLLRQPVSCGCMVNGVGITDVTLLVELDLLSCQPTRDTGCSECARYRTVLVSLNA
jgi:hypothetical protein